MDPVCLALGVFCVAYSNFWQTRSPRNRYYFGYYGQDGDYGYFLILVSLVFSKLSLLNSINSKALQFIVYSGLAGAMSWLFYFMALKNGPADGVVAFDKLSIVFVVILALLFLGEGITWQVGVGAALIVAGAIMMSV